MGGKSSKQAVLDYGYLLDEFKCQYIGSVPVKAATGNDVCQNAVDRILELKVKSRNILLKVCRFFSCRWCGLSAVSMQMPPASAPRRCGARSLAQCFFFLFFFFPWFRCAASVRLCGYGCYVHSCIPLCLSLVSTGTFLLQVTDRGVFLIDSKTSDIIKEVAISEISFVGTSSSDSKACRSGRERQCWTLC
jgi:hypothetical protein